MISKRALATVVLACAAGVLASAGAQARGYGVYVEPPPFTQTVVPNSLPAGTGINTVDHNEPGVPNTATPGLIGTGAAPSGLPGDSPTHPGFPGIVGRD
jgi:hypothetical protein